MGVCACIWLSGCRELHNNILLLLLSNVFVVSSMLFLNKEVRVGTPSEALGVFLLQTCSILKHKP